MSRGHDGRPIIAAREDKTVFIGLLEKARKLTRIRLMAYCVLDNHYHLLIQNVSGRMGEFFKHLNGEYAVYHRRTHGGRGYVFQDRYRSMLIQDDAYLMVALAYILNNPVRAGLCRRFSDYPWSSAGDYFNAEGGGIPDRLFIEELFGTRDRFVDFVGKNPVDELPVIKSELGLIIGGEDFIPSAVDLSERRSGRECCERRRDDDFCFEPPDKVIREFEGKQRIRMDNIPIHTHAGKRLRAELLVALKDRAGLHYREIARMDLFGDMRCASLGSVYKRCKAGQARREE
jgi:hypothetical protein